MVLAAGFPLEFERRGRVDDVCGWWRWSVPPEAQLQGLFGEQRLDQRQVQARHAPSVQHQDLVARTQTWMHREEGFRQEVEVTHISHARVFFFSEPAPSLNASPSGRTSLTKILLFFWLSMCPVTAKPGRGAKMEAEQRKGII